MRYAYLTLLCLAAAIYLLAVHLSLFRSVAETVHPASHRSLHPPGQVRAQPICQRTGTATSAQTAPPSHGTCYTYGVVGSDDVNHVGDDRAAGIGVKVLRVSWVALMPSPSGINGAYVSRKRAEIATLRRAGLQIQVDLGLQNPPAWVHDNYADSYMVDQYGDTYVGGVDGGDANLIWNAAIRALGAQYIHAVFAELGNDFAGVRIGGGRWNETGYPTATYRGKSNTYWAFDAAALARDPVPTWRPGDPSPHGEAQAFLNWYLQRLVDYQTWQIRTVRREYQGALYILYPSFGMRPNTAAHATENTLNGSSPAEVNGDVERGYDFARLINAVTDPRVVVYSTWLDCPYGNDRSTDWNQWSPVRYLAYLAHIHRPVLAVSGENTGHGSASTLQFTVEQMKIYGLIGMNWAFDDDLYTGTYATIQEYSGLITQ